MKSEHKLVQVTRHELFLPKKEKKIKIKYVNHKNKSSNFLLHADDFIFIIYEIFVIDEYDFFVSIQH